MKTLVKHALERLMVSDWMRDALWRHANQLFTAPRQGYPLPPTPYAAAPARYALGQPARADGSNTPLFITARFRSGSTLLWNLFRHLPGHTAYYEPLNENAWFRIAPGRPTDPTHLGASDYAAEYRGLDELETCFDPLWGYRRLYMDEASFDPALTRYIQTLIDRAPGRPVLQFNRVDFRLRWLRANFPHARLLHLYRCPRDQWVSTLRSDPPPGLDARLADFADHDRFYLLPWLADLKTVYPCLDLPGDWHPYAAHYLLWRLSWLHGQQHADLSIAYEALVGNLPQTFADLARSFDLGDVDCTPLLALLQGDHSPRWPRYAAATWFESQEAGCERILQAVLAAPHPGSLVPGPA